MRLIWVGSVLVRYQRAKMQNIKPETDYQTFSQDVSPNGEKDKDIWRSINIIDSRQDSMTGAVFYSLKWLWCWVNSPITNFFYLWYTETWINSETLVWYNFEARNTLINAKIKKSFFMLLVIAFNWWSNFVTSNQEEEDEKYCHKKTKLELSLHNFYIFSFV